MPASAEACGRPRRRVAIIHSRRRHTGEENLPLRHILEHDMGITVAYRGRLADLTRIEDFEDRLLDFALDVGGQAQIWRTFDDDEPRRMVRGVILDLAPGMESTSLLVSPEGWLIGLVDIEDAERGRLKEAPWCFTKTQFGPLEGHVALLEMLAALKREFVPDLEVSDEGGYWEKRDLAELARRCSQVQRAIDGLAEGLRRHGLSPEAAEDPDILVRRIERLATRVHRILGRPAEHPPVEFPDEAAGEEPDPEAIEALWDELFKHNRRQQERLQRAIEERRSRGEEDDSAFDSALGDLGLDLPEEDSGPAEEAGWEEAEPFTEPPDGDVDPDPFEAGRERQPLLQAAVDVSERLHTLFRETNDPRFAPGLHTLFHGAGDMMGGLAQALSGSEDRDDLGLRITQLKRALRGAAFARGALFPLRSAVTAEQFDELRDTLRRMEEGIFQEISRLRSELRAGDSE
jgi:hypothetical protein